MQQTITCTNCNSQNDKIFRFCTTCGARLSAPCSQCGAFVPPDSRYCPECAALCGSGRFGKTQHKVEATQQIINCPNCGSQDTSGRRFCIACGERLSIPCSQCGAIIELASGYCSNCGYTDTTQYKTDNKQEITY